MMRRPPRRRRLPAWAAAALVAVSATLHGPAAGEQARQGLAPDAERARIATERVKSQELLAAEEQACWQRFAVNDCLAAARARHRAVEADLRRQQNVLDAAQRREAAAERQRELDARTDPARQAADEQRRARALAEHEERQARSQEKAARAGQPQGQVRPSHSVGAAPRPVGPARAPATTRPETTPDTQAAARDHTQRVREAQARKERVQQRAAAKKAKEPAKPLPVPP